MEQTLPLQNASDRPKGFAGAFQQAMRVIHRASVSDLFKLLFAATVFVAALWVLKGQLRLSSAGSIVAAFQSTPRWAIAVSVLATALSYGCLAVSESWALTCVGKKLAVWRVALVTFVAYAMSNALGFSIGTGTAARLRFYRAWGLPAPEITTVSLLAGAAVTLSGLVVGGVALLFVRGLPPMLYGLAILMILPVALWLGKLPRKVPFFSNIQLRTPPPGARLVGHKIGESASVDVQHFDLSGRSREDLRHAFSHGQKLGLRFQVLAAGDPATPWQDIETVSNLWLSAAPGSEKHFSLGCFDRSYLSHFQMALLWDPSGLAAFANMVATSDGLRLGADLMRHRPGAAHGVMDVLFIHLIGWAREHGFAQFELGMAPLAGLSTSRVSSLSERLEGWIYNTAEQIYGFKGLRAYKQKFSPTWRPIYLACPVGLSPLIALADVAMLTSRRWRPARDVPAARGSSSVLEPTRPGGAGLWEWCFRGLNR